MIHFLIPSFGVAVCSRLLFIGLTVLLISRIRKIVKFLETFVLTGRDKTWDIYSIFQIKYLQHSRNQNELLDLCSCNIRKFHCKFALLRRRSLILLLLLNFIKYPMSTKIRVQRRAIWNLCLTNKLLKSNHFSISFNLKTFKTLKMLSAVPCLICVIEI